MSQRENQLWFEINATAKNIKNSVKKRLYESGLKDEYDLSIVLKKIANEADQIEQISSKKEAENDKRKFIE